MLGIANVKSDLHLKKTNYSPRGGSRFLFAQKYRGNPVIGSGYLVAVQDDGSIYFISGDYYPDIDVNTAPEFTSLQILALIQDDLAGMVLDSVSGPTLSILAKVDEAGQNYTLVYQSDIRTSIPTTFQRYTIDAKTGLILSKQSLIEDVNGNGDVYLTNPLYGNPTNRILHRLLDLPLPRKLNGYNVIVWNDQDSEAASSTSTFVYGPSNTHFDEVMAYYHSDEFEDWLVGKGLGPNKVAKATIYVHNTQVDQNGIPYYAATDPISRIIYLSDGTWYGFSGLGDPAREAAVIAHEYMHAVSETYHSLSVTSDPWDQEDAMDEAYSDYFGVAYTSQFYSDATIGEYIDQPFGLVYRRELINTNTMSIYSSIDLEPDGYTTAHDRSVIFSGALWDFRRDGDVNASIADELILESLNNLDLYTSFLDGREALEAAATASGYSIYLNDIADAFYAHGIGNPYNPPPPAAPTGLTITNAGQFGQYVQLTWNANPEPDMNHYKVWRECTYIGDPYCNLQVIGTTAGTSYTDNYVTIERHDPGIEQFIYYVSAVDDGSNESAKSLPVNTWGEWWYMKGMDSEIASLPEQYALHPAHPNPFNPVTTIRYALPEPSQVQLVIYDLAGRTVATLVSGFVDAGYGAAQWQGRDGSGRPVPTGVYLYRIIATGLDSGERFTQTRKMVLLK